jgi:hypothetical protein
MLGLEYITVAAYCTGSTILCRDCGEKQALLVRDQLTVADVNTDYRDIGLYCDACSTEIVPEPEYNV